MRPILFTNYFCQQECRAAFIDTALDKFTFQHQCLSRQRIKHPKTVRRNQCVRQGSQAIRLKAPAQPRAINRAIQIGIRQFLYLLGN